MSEERSFKINTAVYAGLPPPEVQAKWVGWSLSKDGRGRGGLIGYGNSSQQAIMSFDLPCAGARRVLDIGYLKNYRAMGAVRVVVRGAETAPDVKSGKESDGATVVVIDGLWKSRASVLDHAVILTPNVFFIQSSLHLKLSLQLQRRRIPVPFRM